MQRAFGSAPPGPRSPLVLDTHDLGRRPGTMVRLRRGAPAPQGFGTAVIAVPEGDLVDLDIRLEAVMEGVLVSGTARASAAGDCVRCLDEVRLDVEVEFADLFAYPQRVRAAQEAGAEEDDRTRELDGDLADLEPVLRDALIPALPFSPVCRADCPGLCSQCGARLADDPDHTHDLTDPRWSALATIFDNPKEN